MKHVRWMLCLSLLALLRCAVSAQTPVDAFNRGNELYRSGKYLEAVKEYESIVQQGKFSAEIYFNLGNAYYREGQLARAILSYERAAQLSPSDPDIEHNLKLAYFKTVDRIEPVPEMFLIQWMHAAGSFLPPETVRAFLAFCWILLFGSLATMYLVLRPEILRAARMVFFVSCVFTALSAAMVGIQSFRDTAQDKAIITAQTVTAKSSPDTKAVDAFVIHEGVKVKLTDAVGDWVKVTLVDGKIGWIPVNQCEKI
ncbi:MAG: tetratricopeptide repeat protein [Ignavibacteriae bacterium]|nr:MAG: tetratricopeptide repeat protein [Ignavibacteriota bacterium]